MIFLFLDVQQVDFPSETDVGLIHVHTIDVVVGTAKMETHISASQRIVLKSNAFKISVFTWCYPCVVWFGFGGKLGSVGVDAGFGTTAPVIYDDKSLPTK